MKIFIAKLPYQYQEADITELFAEYGEVSAVNLIMDRETGRSKCYAFVEMPNDEEAQTAISSLDEKQILDKAIAVSQAKEKTDRPAGGGGYRGGSGGGGFQRGGGGGNSRGGGNYRDKGNGGGFRDRGNDKRSSDY